ncbi:M61 family metallopeptidase [Pedobacter caeni]|uniref:Predicted metalloprotease, contains C-terminal PDZ domain n=1 Tax=Pedobacter caeni TaxID=288992 RepID=A0A1M5MSV6_9SPHI|nr:PDZ domain-containing protein [Pedobacter caeni]SHG80388.1 Predicted metalloprotease, contains C-terminal PDZ domain [Pedobacter caeni]
MRRTILGLSFCFLALTANAQNEISYEVSFPNAIHHEAEIIMNIPAIPNGPLKVKMSRSSPGRYATHEFGKNVYNVRAFDANGKLLKLLQPEGDVYVVEQPGKFVKLSYTLYGNWIDGTYAGFDETHAHMNIPATFAWPVGMDSRPRTVQFKYPERKEWKVATQLKPIGNGKYYAANLQYFMDSSTEISDYKTTSWPAKNPDGKTQTIHLVTHSNDPQEVINGYGLMVKKVVEEQQAIWGEYPTFDYGNYYFLQDVHPENAGDGMEHRNSTSIVERTDKIAGNETDLLGTFSHEFFHAWNVERLRPKTLEPFDFSHSNISDELWIAEGFTQYYGELALKRAGFRTLEQAAQTYTGLVNTALNTPGAKFYSPIQASRYAVFADAGVAIDQTNKPNIFTSYYTYGASIALGLDLQLRAEFKLSLDDYMRALWKAHGKPEIAYTVPDLEAVLATLTNKNFAAEFFRKYIYGVEKNNYQKLLLPAGFVVRNASPGKVWTGFGRLQFTDGKATIAGNTSIGSPAYVAGLDIGDVLLSIDDTPVKDQKGLGEIMNKYQPGTIVTVQYSHRGMQQSCKLTLAESPYLEVVPIEKTGSELSPAMVTFRAQWLDSKIK